MPSALPTGTLGERLAADYLKARDTGFWGGIFSCALWADPKSPKWTSSPKRAVFSFSRKWKPSRPIPGIWRRIRWTKQKNGDCQGRGDVADKNKVPLDVKWQIDVIAVELLPDDRPKISKKFSVRALNSPTLKIFQQAEIKRTKCIPFFRPTA